MEEALCHIGLWCDIDRRTLFTQLRSPRSSAECLSLTGLVTDKYTFKPVNEGIQRGCFWPIATLHERPLWVDSCPLRRAAIDPGQPFGTGRSRPFGAETAYSH